MFNETHPRGLWKKSSSLAPVLGVTKILTIWSHFVLPN